MEDDSTSSLAADGALEWKNQRGEFHRIGKPALIFPNGDVIWFVNDKLHRDDGPAVEYPSENKFEWYKDDEPYEPSAHEIMAWKMKKNETSLLQQKD
jgi:hypothetical protein